MSRAASKRSHKGMAAPQRITTNFRLKAPMSHARTHPAPPLATRKGLITRSMTAIDPHLPAGWAAPIRRALEATPILVHVVRRRKTKHGDHRVCTKRGISIITVNASGNPWQFTITLLHEIAHAHVAQQFTRRVSPHGVEWKNAFRKLLIAHLHLMPDDLARPVADYARNPLYCTGSHVGLATALLKHDTLDLRPTVQELPHGQRFSLNGKTILIRGEIMRRCYRCESEDKRTYRVSPTARVHTLYDSETT